jgi:hypothetical protein
LFATAERARATDRALLFRYCRTIATTSMIAPSLVSNTNTIGNSARRRMAIELREIDQRIGRPAPLLQPTPIDCCRLNRPMPAVAARKASALCFVGTAAPR